MTAKAKAKSVLAIVGEALETAAGFALVAVALYAVVFVDFTGGGSLWKSLGYLREDAQAGFESPNATRVIKVATQVGETKAHEDRILAVFDAGPKGEVASAIYQAPDATDQRPSAALTDTPADPQAGKSWKRGLTGELRNFTVYGAGQQTTSASLSAAPASGKTAGYAPAAVSGAASQHSSDAAVVARPGLGSRMSSGGLASSEASRNIR